MFEINHEMTLVYPIVTKMLCGPIYGYFGVYLLLIMERSPGNRDRNSCRPEPAFLNTETSPI